jgi:LmbE family N-acetylglucosaminyl deacetylase
MMNRVLATSILAAIFSCFSCLAADSGSERILIFAPHPDDEALSSPGLVRKALSRGDKVKVVLFTCGDANTNSMNSLVEKFPEMTYDRDGDGDFDMIDYGILRHDESISGIKLMGLTPDDVIFMGYPDGGGGRLWRSSDPQMSPYTHTDKVPEAYSFAYNPGSPYNREGCLGDFVSIIKDFNPTIVVTSRPTDTHGDHWSLCKFVSQALMQLHADLPDFKAHLGYLIHWEKHQPDWPEDTLNWEQPANHPKPHIEIDLAEYGLSVEQKKHIIDQHFTQTLNFGRYLRNFAKETEIFWLESLGPAGTLVEIFAW